MATRLAILGNCQAQLLESMFEYAGSGVTIERFIPNFEMNEGMRWKIIQRLATADVIFAQRVSAEYRLPWLTPGFLKQTFGSKVICWPNIYFDGYFPGVHYIYLPNWGKLQSPLEDYHLVQVAESYKQGLSAFAAVQALTQSESLICSDPFGASLARLRSREADVDITISDFLESNMCFRRCMYTTNHPFNFVLAETGRRLAREAGLHFDCNAAADYDGRLDRIYIPAFPSVRRRYGLVFDKVNLYRGLEIKEINVGSVLFGKPRSFFPDLLVEEFYRIYDVAFGGVSRTELRQGSRK